jgi:hypothetical protein
MMPAVVALLPTSPHFFFMGEVTNGLLTDISVDNTNFVNTLTDAQQIAAGKYVQYCSSLVTACIGGLASSVTDKNNTLWKALNHKVLLITRDSHKYVRVTAVKTLHHLFSSVSSFFITL